MSGTGGTSGGSSGGSIHRTTSGSGRGSTTNPKRRRGVTIFVFLGFVGVICALLVTMSHYCSIKMTRWEGGDPSSNPEYTLPQQQQQPWEAGKGARKRSPEENLSVWVPNPPLGFPWQDGLFPPETFRGGLDRSKMEDLLRELDFVLHKMYTDEDWMARQRQKHPGDPQAHIATQPMLLLLHTNGHVYGMKQQLYKIHTVHMLTRFRALEQMFQGALELGRQFRHLQPRFQAVVGSDEEEEEEEKLTVTTTSAIPVLIYWEDFGDCFDSFYPRFTFCRPPVMAHYPCQAMAIPGYDAWDNHGLYDSADAITEHVLEPYAAEFPWHSKLPQAVWRGATTGPNVDHWYQLPRVRMVQIANRDAPHQFDVALHALVQLKPHEELELRQDAHIRMAPAIPFRDFMKYRAILDIDGNTWSSRFARLLCMNSVIIKVEPDSIDYFHQELTPWVHYVPVKRDLSDLVEVTSHVVADENQRAMRLIVRAANDWCRAKLTPTAMKNDLLWLLVSYVELLDKQSGTFDWRDPWNDILARAQAQPDKLISMHDFWNQHHHYAKERPVKPNENDDKENVEEEKKEGEKKEEEEEEEKTEDEDKDKEGEEVEEQKEEKEEDHKDEEKTEERRDAEKEEERKDEEKEEERKDEETEEEDKDEENKDEENEEEDKDEENEEEHKDEENEEEHKDEENEEEHKDEENEENDKEAGDAEEVKENAGEGVEDTENNNNQEATDTDTATEKETPTSGEPGGTEEEEEESVDASEGLDQDTMKRKPGTGEEETSQKERVPKATKKSTVQEKATKEKKQTQTARKNSE